MLNKLITTYSKIHFAPTDPKAEDIKTEDIAHALSLMCRANGHLKNFYSVAQHSINCQFEAKARGYSKKVQLACLLHDASEAYLADITRPVKQYLPQYQAFEQKLQTMIYDRYLGSALTEEEIRQITEIDDAMLYHEFVVLMEERIFEVEPELKEKPNLETRNCRVVEHQFLNLFKILEQSIVNPSLPEPDFISVGVDGCMGKWLVVAITESRFEVNLMKTIGDVCGKYQNADSIMVDMPIGLPESLTDIRPDSELRKRLKGKASSVFSTPCRQSVYTADYTKAIEENKNALHISINPLSHAIIPKIREVDCFLQKNSEWKNRLVESHSEFCFAVLNKNTPIRENKQTLIGVQKRVEVLNQYYPESFSVVEQFQRTAPTALCSKLDNVIDALALAVVGSVGIKNGFRTIPQVPMEDSTGIKMQVVYANL